MVKGDELWLPRAFACNQALLHIFLVEAVQSGRRKGATDENREQEKRETWGKNRQRDGADNKKKKRFNEGINH